MFLNIYSICYEILKPNIEYLFRNKDQTQMKIYELFEEKG